MQQPSNLRRNNIFSVYAYLLVLFINGILEQSFYLTSSNVSRRIPQLEKSDMLCGDGGMRQEALGLFVNNA